MPKRPDDGFKGKLAKARVGGEPKRSGTIAAKEIVFDDPFGRAQYFRRARVGADGRVLRAAIAKASASKRRAERRRGEHVKQDYLHFSTWVKPSGYVAFHDCALHFPGVKICRRVGAQWAVQDCSHRKKPGRAAEKMIATIRHIEI